MPEFMSVMPSSGPMPTSGPSFSDIMSRLNSSVTGGNTISPETQYIMKLLQENQNFDTNKGVSEAQALAGRRGLAGSSIEQFGTATAAGDVGRRYDNLRGNVLLDNLARNDARYFFDQNMAMQQQLGQQGIDVARENMRMAEEMANDQARNGLISSVIQGGMPYLLPKLFGAGAPGFLGAGGGIPGLQGGVGLVNGAIPGQGGMGMFGNMGSFGPLAGIAAAMAIRGGMKKGTFGNLGNSLIKVAQPFFAPDKTIKSISKKVKKIFPF